jgi:hypothetical protein
MQCVARSALGSNWERNEVELPVIVGAERDRRRSIHCLSEVCAWYFDRMIGLAETARLVFRYVLRMRSRLGSDDRTWTRNARSVDMSGAMRARSPVLGSRPDALDAHDGPGRANAIWADVDTRHQEPLISNCLFGYGSSSCRLKRV